MGWIGEKLEAVAPGLSTRRALQLAHLPIAHFPVGRIAKVVGKASAHSDSEVERSPLSLSVREGIIEPGERVAICGIGVSYAIP